MAELPYWDDVNLERVWRGADDSFGDLGAWDRLQLGPHHMPGAWHVEVTCERELDKKKTKGKDGAKVNDAGYKQAEITMQGRITSRADWTLMQKILLDLHSPKKGKERSPYLAVHPALAVMGVSQVYIKQIKAPEISNGVMVMRIECLEIAPPVKAKPKMVAKPASAGGYPNFSLEQLEANEDFSVSQVQGGDTMNENLGAMGRNNFGTDARPAEQFSRAQEDFQMTGGII